MVARRDWFTIVATDLFAGSFAAILIIDSVTPKELAGVGELELIEIEYDAPAGSFVDCDDPGAVVFSFEDDTGERFNTLDQGGFAASRNGTRCKVLGVIGNVALTGPPENPRALVVEFDPSVTGGQPQEIDVTVGGRYQFKCLGDGSCP